MPARKIKVGLVGFGVAAKVMHAPFLATNDGYNVVAVLERHATESKQLFPDAIIVRSIEDMLQQDIELVIITTPNETHLPYAMQALKAGKHVVLEKPFTITSDDAQTLIDTAEKEKKILSVFQNRRYVADFLTIREILDKKLLGDIHEFEGRYDRYRPQLKIKAWREEDLPGSGILYDLGAHLIDQALLLFGLPKTVTADIRIQRPGGKVDDYFDVRLDYGFCKATLKAGMLVKENGPRYIINGVKGSFIKYGEDPQEVKLKAGESPVSENWGEEPNELYGLLHTEEDGKDVRKNYTSLKGNFGYYYENLYQTIINGKPLNEKAEHGYNTIRIIELCRESNDKKATIKCVGLKDISYKD